MKPPTPIRTVLCPVDFSPLSERALQLAVEMCARTGARLVLEHNLAGAPPNYLGVGWMYSEEEDLKEKAREDQATQKLRELFEQVPAGIEYEGKLTRGPVEDDLLQLAAILPADLIVMGTHGPSNIEHRSLTERIIIQAPCPVLTTGENYKIESVFVSVADESPERMSVLVPFDFSSRSRACLAFATAMAQRMPHHIHLLHAAAPSGIGSLEIKMERKRSELLKLVPPELKDRMTVSVVDGQPVETILETARKVEALFILMPAHGKSPWRRSIFGTTTLEVLHGSECPVWFLPAAARRGFKRSAA